MTTSSFKRRIAVRALSLSLLITQIPAAGAVTVTEGQATAQRSITDIKDAARRVRTAAMEIISDVEQRPLAPMTDDPLYIEPMVFKPKEASFWAKEQSELGHLEQPRKSWLDADMAHLGQWIQVLQADVDGSVVKSSDKSEAKGGWAEVSGVMPDVQSHYKKLQELTAGPKYDNLAIGAAALTIYDDMGKFSKPLGRALHSMKHGGGKDSQKESAKDAGKDAGKDAD